MRVLVIGGTGFVGPNVVRRLAEDDHEVTVFHRGETEGELPPTVADRRRPPRRPVPADGSRW